MRILPLLTLLLLTAPLLGQAPPAENEGKVLRESWDVIYLGGARGGYVHTTIRQLQRDGKPVVECTLDTHLRFKRFTQVVSMGIQQRSEETPEGKVQILDVATRLDKGELVQRGRVEGDSIVVKVGNDPTPRKLRWDHEAMGPARQESLWADRKLEPGLVVRYKNFDPAIATSISLTAQVKGREEALILVDKGTPDQPRGEQTRQSLWRIEVSAEPVMVGGQTIKLPDQTVWVDDSGRILRAESEMPGLGRMTQLRATKGLATLENAAPAEMPDLLVNTLVKLDRPIPNAHDASKITYRITVQGDQMPQKAFSADARQKPADSRGDQFTLTVQALREPAKVEFPAPADEENLRSTQMLDSSNQRITELAARVTNGLADPWEKARKLESWVHDNMKPTTAIGLVKASQVCADLKGDCRQHAMLLAALCRAAGIPARTAQGLVYVNDRTLGPLLGFHMWTEVWVKGQWVSLDATLGKGSVGPAHLKIGESSWKDGEGLAPLMSLLPVMGRLKIEVVSVE